MPRNVYVVRKPLGARKLARSNIAVSFPPAGGQTIVVGQVTETDVANAIAWAPKQRLVGQSVETDLAQAITVRRIYTIVQALETDLAQVITSRKIKLITQVVETDIAQAIAWAPKHRLVNQALETDLAQAITAAQATVVAVGQVVETNIAQAIAWAPKKRLVGQATENDLAQVVTVGFGAPAPLLAGTVPIRYILSGEIRNVVPVETVGVGGIGVVPCRVMVGPENVVPVRETVEEPRVKIVLV